MSERTIMPAVPKQVVLICRRCSRPSHPSEAINVGDYDHKQHRWKCPECGGTCDAIELSPNKLKRR